MKRGHYEETVPVLSAAFRDPVSTEAAELERLLTLLNEGKKSERVAAARSLRYHGADAVEPLCAKLKDNDDELRREAAQSLGLIGDPRAVEPLIAALRANCLGGSAHAHRKYALQLFVTWLVLVVVTCLAMRALIGNVNPAFLGGLSGSVVAWAMQRPIRGKTFRIITKALERIAETNPAPDVRGALPDLQVLAGDRIQQDRKTRKALRAAIERIDALTQDLGCLPIAAKAPGLEIASLPTPASSHTVEAEALPRVS